MYAGENEMLGRCGSGEEGRGEGCGRNERTRPEKLHRRWLLRRIVRGGGDLVRSTADKIFKTNNFSQDLEFPIRVLACSDGA